MADAFRSQPSSPPPAGGMVEDAKEGGQFQETELFEDTLVINSPFTEVENLSVNTEVIDDSDSDTVECRTTGPVSEHEQEVVLDSEDEEMNSAGAMTVAKGFLEDETGPKVRNLSMLFKKRRLQPPCEQAHSNAINFGKSAATGLNHIHSPQPADSTQEALGFVDQYLSSNSMDSFEGIHCRKITREKSPNVMIAGGVGPLSLAKKIKARTHNEAKEPFKWVGCDKNDKNADIFCEKVEASANFRSYRLAYKRRRQKKDDPLQNQGNCSPGNRCDKSVQGPRMATENNNSLKELDAELRATRENLNVYSNVPHTEGMYDIGLDTQIAAEAMDALANEPPPAFCFNDADQPENAFGGSLSDLNEDCQKSYSYRQDPALHSVTLKSNKINVSSCRFRKLTSSSSCLDTENQEPNCVTGKTKKMMKSKSTVEGQFGNDTSKPIYSEHVPLEDGCSLGKYVSFQPSAREPRNLSNESKWTRIKDQPSHHTAKDNNVKEKGVIRHKKGNGLVADPVKLGVKTKHPKLPTNSCGEARKSRLNHQVLVSPRLSATSSFSSMDSWVYPKRPRGKGKRANVQINPNAPATLCIDGKESNIYSTRCLEGQDVDKSFNRLNHQVLVSPRLSATSSFSSIDSWVYLKRPRGKRKRANVQTNPNAPTTLCIDGKESNIYSTRCLEGQDVDKSCNTRSPCNASSIVNGRCVLQGTYVQPGSAGNAITSEENLHDIRPLLQAHVEILSNKSAAKLGLDIPATVASSESIKISNASHTYNKNHKKSCDKSLPKSSLLKELIRLGVPESSPVLVWRDLRHRRDMAHVRVLFSQHLEDSVIKKQKKILARFNIPIASSSMEATHFVADKFTRTKNMLEVMALGKIVVTHLWLESCGQANCFIDEKNYILRDMKKEKEIGFSMPASLARARQKPLLKGRRVYITPHIKPDKEMVTSLVTAVHGQVLDESQICGDKNDNILDDLLILSCEDDYAICCDFLKRGTAVYSSELVLNGIVVQKLEFERHKLFMNQVRRINPSTSNRFGKVYRRR
ncbi:uncharacterized protein LOC130730881 [Lotus japonicus]|uniref:uncharacterized protein LOC130730881 n=1 Tax=Lotus japonicus TaxID=34305 RepID=UPI00258561D6|nr:uncharacterized protein LOC130730881 [Lotus japonicus]